MINYTPSPTGKKFLDSRAYIKAIMGPVGGGKSTVALMDLVARAVNQTVYKGVRRSKMGILRNTTAQLKATVKPLLDQWFVTMTDGSMGRWRLTDNTFEVQVGLPDGTEVHSEFMLLAADTPDDVRRLLSLELSAAWVEEAREVDPEVFSGLQGRVARFPSRAAGGVKYPGLICSTNPPPVGGFWHDMIVNPPSNTEVFLQPAAILDDGSINPDAENLENLDPEYYQNLLPGKTDAWIDVYLKNEFGAGDMGQPIYKASFRKSFHIASSPLQAISGSVNPLIVGMDNGLQAAAAIGQQDMRGRVNILAEAYVPEDQTMGVESFLDRILIPKLTSKFPTFPKDKIVFVVDPACFQRSQVDEKTVAQAVSQRGYAVVKAGTNDPERRVQAVEGLLTRQIDGAAGFLVDPSCTHVSQALEWGHRWKKTSNGLTSHAAEKNHYSHCFAAGTMVATPEGSIPIEKMTCEHFVLTPRGQAKVAAVMAHQSSTLMELRFSDGAVITCTHDHPFFTKRGVVLANALEYNEVLFTLGERTCPEPNIQYKSFSASGTTVSQAGTTNPILRNTEDGTCTASFGSRLTELSPTNITSIMPTAIARITELRTWSACLLRSMRGTIQPSATPPRKVEPVLCAGLPPLDRVLPNGTDRKQGENGTVSTEKLLGNSESAPNSLVRTVVAGISGLWSCLKRGFAPCHAKEVLAKSPGLTTRPDSALSAAEPSRPTSTSKPEPAVRLVGKRHLVGQSARVYDLTVPVEHCFYANGVLVSNCGDAVQYLALHYNMVEPGRGWQASKSARTITKSKYLYA